MDGKLLALLRQLLGEPENPDVEWVYFSCPFCDHHRKKFAFNVQSHAWHCWVCKKKGNNLFSLLRALNKWHLFKPKVQEINRQKRPAKKRTKTKSVQIQLPKQFISLSEDKEFPLKKKALNYLRRRGVGTYQIWKYDIGFSNSGRYADRIIIPSYDENNQLNYFNARSIHAHENLKYLNPRFQKDQVIIFQNMINWNFPLILTQGVFDAITVNYNCVPLMGKTLSKKLLQKILYYDAEICLSLDGDAQEDQYEMLKQLNKLGLQNISFLKLGKVKDPATMNRWQYWKYLLQNRKAFSQEAEFDILKEKVGKMVL